MKKVTIAIFLLGTLVSPCFAGGIDFVFDLQPAAVLVSSDIDGFAVSRSGSSWWEWEEIEGTTSLIPTFRAGIGFDTRPAYIDLKGGVGYLYNGAFTSPLLLADAAIRFKLGRAVTFGPRIGVINFASPSWSEEADLTIDKGTGLMGGLDFSVGRKISFLLSIDYVDAVLDVTTGSGWVATSNQLDLSGVAVRMGINGRF